jgi:hypothetical protein
MEIKEERMARRWAEFEQRQREKIEAEEQPTSKPITTFVVPQLSFSLRSTTLEAAEPKSPAVEPAVTTPSPQLKIVIIPDTTDKAETRDADVGTHKSDSADLVTYARRPSAATNPIDGSGSSSKQPRAETQNTRFSNT